MTPTDTRFRSFAGLVWLAMGLTGFAAWYHVAGSVVEGLFGAAIVMGIVFIGMTIALVDAHNQTKMGREQEAEQFQKKMQETTAQERRLCGQASVNMAKAVADRVANRIVSKYVTGMDDDNVRDSVLNYVGQIICEEVGVLQKVVEDESDEAKKD